MNKILNVGEVWYVKFPYEEDDNKFSVRPAVILDIDKEELEVLSVKVTTHEPRDYDTYDTPIVYWEKAKLRAKSTARVAKTIYIPKKAFERKLGNLHEDDLTIIQELFMKYVQEQKQDE